MLTHMDASSFVLTHIIVSIVHVMKDIKYNLKQPDSAVSCMFYTKIVKGVSNTWYSTYLYFKGPISQSPNFNWAICIRMLLNVQTLHFYTPRQRRV